MAWAPFVCMVAIGGLLLLVGINELVRANATKHWPTATATIVTSTVGKSKTVRTFLWVPAVSFTYRVGTQTYTSSRYSASSQIGFFIRRSVERILARHPPGSRVLVSYPPSDPANAILAAGMRPVFSSAMRFVVLAVLIFAAALNFGP